MSRTQDVEKATSTVPVPERYETDFSDGTKASTDTKAEVLREMDRQREPILRTDDIESEVSVGAKQVKRAIDDLRDDEIVLRLQKANNTNLYYLNHPDTEYPKPPDMESPEEIMSFSPRDYLRLNNETQVRVLAINGFIIGMGLALLGSLIGIFVPQSGIGADVSLSGVYVLLFVMLIQTPYMAAEVIDWITAHLGRSDDGYRLTRR